MTVAIEIVMRELKQAGYPAVVKDTPLGKTVVFDYDIDAGKYCGKKVMLGISMQDTEMYPEYPPHWIHISPPYNDSLGGAMLTYETGGQKWLALSRPPGNFWDELATKHMKAYMDGHVRRFCQHLR